MIIILLVIMLTLTVYDFLYPDYSPTRNCTIEIYDPFSYLTVNLTTNNNICLHNSLSPIELRLIGKTNAKIIVLITHVLNKVENGKVKDVALGVSSPSIFERVLPIESYYLVKGDVGGEEVFGEEIGFLDHLCCINGKTIILVTCYKAGTDMIIEKLRSLGARIIYVKYTETTRSIVEDVVSKIISFKDPSKLCLNKTAFGCN